MATTRRVTATGWDGDALRIQTDGPDIPWQEGLHWDVDEEVAPEYLVMPPCVFEPRCLLGDEPCNCTIGNRPHVVYAAFYGTLPKVGLTSARRFATRLREQGADAGFVVARCANRGEARRMEKDLAFTHRIPEWRTHKEKFPQLTRPIAWNRIEDRVREWQAKLGVADTEWIRITHPLPVLAKRPHRVEPVGVHEGNVLGAKGPYIFYEPTGLRGRLAVGSTPVLALKHSDLVGRRVTFDY